MNLRALNNLKHCPGVTGNFSDVSDIPLALLSRYLPSLSVSLFLWFSAPLFLFPWHADSPPLCLSLALTISPVAVSSNLTTLHLSPFLRLSHCLSCSLVLPSPCLPLPLYPQPPAQSFVQLALNNSVLSNVEEDIYILQEWAHRKRIVGCRVGLST